jgi:hypothetical protein
MKSTVRRTGCPQLTAVDGLLRGGEPVKAGTVLTEPSDSDARGDEHLVPVRAQPWRQAAALWCR